MNTETVIRLTDADECPLAGGHPTELWVENYALVAGDTGAGLNLCLYMGSQPFDRTLWHEIVLLSLPGGGVFAAKAAGRGQSTRGPTAAMAAFRCLEAGSRWEASFDGYGRVVEADELAAGPLIDGPLTRAAFSLRFEAAGPPWVLGDASLEHAWEHSHYEQPGRVAGTVTVGSERWEFNGSGHRDHSRGPRDFASVLDHAWVNCLFPSGRFFALYRMRLPGGIEGVAAACVGDSASVRSAVVRSMPLLAEADEHQRYTLELEVDSQRTTIHAEIVSPVGILSYMTPNSMVIGSSGAAEACQVVREGATRFVWDGELGFGHTQRSVAAAARGDR